MTVPAADVWLALAVIAAVVGGILVAGLAVLAGALLVLARRVRYLAPGRVRSRPYE